MQVSSPREMLQVEWHSEGLYLIVIGAVALTYRLLPLNRGLGEDELFTTVQFIEVPSIFRTVFYNIAFNNHIGYSVMARLSEAVLGRGEWVLRLPALLLGMATLYVLYIFGRSLLGRYPALLATLLLALSPAHIGWSVSARGYSALIFFTLLSSHFFFKLLQAPSRRDAVLFVVTSVLGIYVHLYALFVTGIQIAFVLYSMFIRSAGGMGPADFNAVAVRLLRNCFVTVGVLVLVLYLPVVWFMLRDLGARGWSNFDPGFPWEVADGLVGIDRPPVVILVVLSAVLGWFSLHRSHPFQANYLAWLLLGPLVLMWLVHPFDLYPRFFAYWLPYLLILFTAGVVKLFYSMRREHGAASYVSRVASVCLVVVLVLVWKMGWQNAVADEGYREISQVIVKNANPSAAYCAIGGDRSIWKYYIKEPIVNPLTLAEFRELALTHPEVRCVYYAASWQDQGQTEIAHFLSQHASASRIKDLAWFVYRSGSTN